MSDYVDIVVNATPDIVEVVVQQAPAFIEVINEQVIERVIAEDKVMGETPAGLLNGSNATFTTAFDFVPASLAVYLNGLRQKISNGDYNSSGTTQILFSTSPAATESITVDYIKQ